MLGNIRKRTIEITPSPHKRAATKHLHTRGKDYYSDSSESSAGGVAECKIDDLLLSVRDIGNKFTILVSNSRPKTHLGKKQGDHATAFISFIEVLVSASEDKRAKDVASYFADVGRALSSDKSYIFDDILTKFREKADSRISRGERKKIIKKLRRENAYYSEKSEKLKASLKDAERAMIKDIIQEMGEALLKQINLEKNIAFKKSGEGDKGEGSKVKIATHALKAINQLETIMKDLNTPDDTLEFFYHDYIKIGAKYKDGFNAMVDRNVSSKVFKEWTGTSRSKRDILEELYTNVTPEKTAEFFGNLFDFDYNKHKNDGLEILYEVIARHLVIMFHAFDSLQKYDNSTRNKIIDYFLQNEILEKSQWSESEVNLNLDSLKEEIAKFSDIQSGIFRMKTKVEIATQEIPFYNHRGMRL